MRREWVVLSFRWLGSQKRFSGFSGRILTVGGLDRKTVLTVVTFPPMEAPSAEQAPLSRDAQQGQKIFRAQLVKKNF